MKGRSDYAPFLDNGVPAAGETLLFCYGVATISIDRSILLGNKGLACGAEVLKNADEQHVFGGLQGSIERASGGRGGEWMM